jgi:hypothetical protein
MAIIAHSAREREMEERGFMENTTQQQAPPRAWGRWTLNRTKLELVGARGQPLFFIELGQTATPERILNWLLFVNRKIWARPEDVRDLLNAIGALIDPEAAYLHRWDDRKPYSRQEIARRLRRPQA